MSPIVGLTDTVTPQFGNLGYLYKGGPKKVKTRPDGTSYETFGDDLDHFRFTSDRPQVVKAFNEKYGEAPAELRIFLPFADPDQDWSAWKELWKAGGILHRCNGKDVVLWLDAKAKNAKGQSGVYVTDPQVENAEGDMIPMPCPGGCVAIGRLKVILPGLWQAGYVGTVTMVTKSLNDIMHIEAVLRATWEARMDARTQEGLKGVEFTVSRRKEAISTPGENGQRVKRDKWLVKLEPSTDWLQLQLAASRNISNRMIEAGDITVDEEDEQDDMDAGDPDFKQYPGGMKVDLKTGEMIQPPTNLFTVTKPVQGTISEVK